MFQVYDTQEQGWYWRLISPSGEIIAYSSRGYETSDICRSKINLIKDYVRTALIIPSTPDVPPPPPPPPPRFQVYDTQEQGWYWQLISPSGEIIAYSSRGYETSDICRSKINLIKDYVRDL